MFRINLLIKKISIPVCLLVLTACGGGSEIVTTPEEMPVAAACVTSNDINNNDNCGTLLLGITDADGDFLTYQVEISAIELERADGARVSVMATSQMVDFVDYIELSELASAATVPAGIYIGGSITVNYLNADIQVEKDSAAVTANMLDADGMALTSMTLDLQFDQNNPLIIARRRPAMLELDFNLAISHSVDLTTSPVSVTTEPYIIAEIDPVLNKEFRVRGPLLSVNEQESYYRVAIRPFHRRTDSFGGVNVQVNSETSYLINQEMYSGGEGLAQLALLEQGTATVTMGNFNRDQDNFTAIAVYAGSSVPGNANDAAKGVIVARQGNILTIRGASLVRSDGDLTFSDEINVLIADTTKVNKPRRIQEEVTIANLSVGQAVTIFGTIEESDSGVSIDASEGVVHMNITFASGHAVSNDSAEIVMDLQSLQGRRPQLFDFSGTGIDPDFDANAAEYQVDISNLMVSQVQPSDPVRVSGFVTPFGTAPADFEALTVIDYSTSRSQLFVDWPAVDDGVWFSEISTESLTINIINQGEEGIYKLIQGGIRTDLTSFDSAVVIQPLALRGIYTIRGQGVVMAFSSFADFSVVLQQQLDAGNSIDSMHAIGGFSNETKIFKALKLAVKLD